MNDEQPLKEIALELLEMYRASEETAIGEFSSELEKDLNDLERECCEYKKKIKSM